MRKELLAKTNRRRMQINGERLLPPSIEGSAILYRRVSLQFVYLGTGRGLWGKLLARARWGSTVDV